MTRKLTSAADATPIRVVIVTMDTHLAAAIDRARIALTRDLPGLALSLHAASEWAADDAALERCRADIACGDIVIATMLFLEEHFLPILDALQARRLDCDALVCAMSASEVVKLTRIGRFDMDKPANGPIALLKRLRGGKGSASTGGAQQMKMLRRIPQLLRFIPGTAQDVRAYFMTLQYWLAGSDENIQHMVRFLVDRYATGPRAALRGTVQAHAPVQYPEIGV
jgi:magnesium chelatase subunit H